MAPSGAAHRKSQPVKAGKGAAVTGPTIRVAVPIAPVVPEPLEAMPAPEEAHAPGLPCTGRCGHCNYHPCRLHSPI